MAGYYPHRSDNPPVMKPQSGGIAVVNTVLEAADKMKVSSSTVYALCRANRLTHTRVGVGRGVIRISDEDIEAYLAGNTTAARNEASKPVQPALKLKHLRL